MSGIDITKIWAWFKKIFTSIKTDIDKTAIVITEYIKAGLESGVLDAIAKALDGLTSHLSTEVIALLRVAVPKALAIELAIQGLPDNPTGDDIKAFENAVLAAVVNSSDFEKSQLWTNLSAQVFNLISDALKANDGKLTFAQIVLIVEQSYQDYLADKANG